MSTKRPMAARLVAQMNRAALTSSLALALSLWRAGYLSSSLSHSLVRSLVALSLSPLPVGTSPCWAWWVGRGGEKGVSQVGPVPLRLGKPRSQAEATLQTRRGRGTKEGYEEGQGKEEGERGRDTGKKGRKGEGEEGERERKEARDTHRERSEGVPAEGTTSLTSRL